MEYDVRWITVIIAAITAAITVGLLNYKSWLRSLHLWILGIFEHTTTKIDEQMYIVLINTMSNYVTSDKFKQHWNNLLQVVNDGKLTQEEVELLKQLFVHQLVKELINIGVDIYTQEGKNLICQAIDEFAAFIIRNASDEMWLTKIGIRFFVNFVSNWVKSKLDEWVLYNRVKTYQYILR